MKMIKIMQSLTLLVLMSFWKIGLLTDAEVSCVVKQSCVFPCSFQSDSEPVIHWTQLQSSELTVHSYYSNQDQLDLQNQNFRGRTSLFQDQISRGNASLLLREVKVQDQGRYNCFISTIKGHQDSIIRLSVDAPGSDIRIHQDGNRTTCSSEGIYPQPELTWSTEPPSNTTLQNRTTVHQTEEKLYDISSSLIDPDGSDWIYSCTIRTRSNQRRATFRKLSSVTVTTDETTLPCLGLNGSVCSLEIRPSDGSESDGKEPVRVREVEETCEGRFRAWRPQSAGTRSRSGGKVQL
ncbi:CD276 antigen-like [Poeciliopsis prolifica]|uniref:CD276 antigen-like n=1 Tax=Poeciliopsis prolifica TaxID=188132 RepID=UPI002413EE40|nr:CD276 antigen-like [Poeciliopsis prolifica]